MRRWTRIAPVLAIACSALLAGAPAADAGRTDKLVVDSVTEPPDFQSRGGKWRLTVTVSNEGNGSSVSDRIRFYLSRGRRFSNDDLQRRLSGVVNIPELARNRQATRRVTLRIPQSIQDGVYYLVSCLGRAQEDTDALNCRFSGQTMTIGRQVSGQAQSQSVPSPGGPGAAGPPGRDGSGTLIEIPRTPLALGTALGGETRRGLRDSRNARGGRLARGGQQASQDDEGSTSTVQLAKVGPVSVIGLCRATTNGDDGAPGSGFGTGFNFDEDGDEALILFRLDDGAGTMTWRGPQGPRRNIPPGDTIGDPQSVEDPEDDFGGTGKHLALAAARDPAPVVTDNGNVTSGPEDDWETGWMSGSVFAATSGGDEFVMHAYAGIDVLGVGDQCVFGGGITVINDA
jgi:hypothetical protein